MQNAWLNEAQEGNKIARRNVNNCLYLYDIILMAESEEELKSLLIKVFHFFTFSSFRRVKMLA